MPRLLLPPTTTGSKSARQLDVAGPAQLDRPRLVSDEVVQTVVIGEDLHDLVVEPRRSLNPFHVFDLIPLDEGHDEAGLSGVRCVPSGG